MHHRNTTLPLPVFLYNRPVAVYAGVLPLGRTVHVWLQDTAMGP